MFTAQIDGMSGLDYWQRLSSLSLYSQERRRERYQIIFLWKVAQGLVKGYNATFTQNDRRGRLMVLAPLCNRAPAAVRKAREASLQVRCADRELPQVTLYLTKSTICNHDMFFTVY